MSFFALLTLPCSLSAAACKMADFWHIAAKSGTAPCAYYGSVLQFRMKGPGAR